MIRPSVENGAPPEPRRLVEIQQALAALVLGEERRAPALGTIFAAPPRGTLAERVAVHVEGRFARLAEAIEDVFPAVRMVLGRTEFAALVERYLVRVPARSWSLADAGAELSRVLRDDALVGSLPFLADLAALEWAVFRSFVARDEPRAEPTALTARFADLDGDVRVILHPSVFVVASRWPIRTIWRQREAPRESIHLAVGGRAEAALVHRRGLDVRCDDVAPDEAELLGAIASGTTIDRLVERVRAGGAGPEHLGVCLARWMTLGLVAAIETAPAAA